MAIFSLFSAPGRWFRGNCHTHSTLSDGDTTPQQLANAYRRAGYDFLVMTDHNTVQENIRELCAEGFLAINGIEMHPPVDRARRLGDHHIIGLGVRRAPPADYARRWLGKDVISWIKRQGGIAIYGHPYWTGHSIEHIRTGSDALGMEVFNTVCESTRGLGDADAHLDMALSDGLRWFAFATDDLHNFDRDAFGSWIMVKSRALTQQAILRAIRKGHFYATQGPAINSIRIHEGAMRVECSPVRRLVWHSDGPKGVAHHSRGKLLTTWDVPLKQLAVNGRYLRLEITDAQGRKAWSNPVWRTSRGWSD